MCSCFILNICIFSLFIKINTYMYFKNWNRTRSVYESICPQEATKAEKLFIEQVSQCHGVTSVTGKGESYGQAGTRTNNLQHTRRMVNPLGGHVPVTLHFSTSFLQINFLPQGNLTNRDFFTNVGYLVRRQL